MGRRNTYMYESESEDEASPPNTPGRTPSAYKTYLRENAGGGASSWARAGGGHGGYGGPKAATAGASRVPLRPRSMFPPMDDESTDQEYWSDERSTDEEDRPGAHRVNGYSRGGGGGTGSRYSPRNTFEDDGETLGTWESTWGTRDHIYGREGLMSAFPIDEDYEGELREKMLEEERRAAEARLRQEGIQAQEYTFELEIKDSKHDRLRRQCCVAGLLFTLHLLIMLTWACVYFFIFLGHGSPADIFTPAVETSSPTMAPTETPPIFKPSDRDSEDYNDACEGAFTLEEAIGGSIFGTTVNATFDDDIGACEVVDSNGRGVWYRLSGDNRRMMASTCDRTFFDTKISIFKGVCGKLQCVSGNDQIACGTGDQSQVAWFAEPNTEYFIYVHGHREAAGLFNLAVDQMADNDMCEDSIEVQLGDEPTFGSTRGAANDGVANCGTARQTAPGVWYSTTGTGNIMSANLLTAETTAFRGQVSVFTAADDGNNDIDIVDDDCSDGMQCVEGSVIGFASWESVIGQKYYILVHGQSVLEGDFRLELGELPALPPTPGVGDTCSSIFDATPLEVGTSVTGSTVDEPVFEVESCGSLVFSTAGGVWFRTRGTGNPLTVSTCDDETDFDTQISVYAGSCYYPQCVDGNDQIEGCGDSSSVSWFTIEGEQYFILVHGFNDRHGNFALSLEEAEVEGSDDCGTAVSISADGRSLLGITDGAVNSLVPSCDSDVLYGISGLWYRLDGEGKNVTASTCQEYSSAPATVTIFTGTCGRLECVDSYAIPCGSQSLVSFEGVKDQEYFIFVQDTSITDLDGRKMEGIFEGDFDFATRVPDGSFVLTVENTPENDVCADAFPIEADGSEIRASTRSATNIDADTCNGEIGPGARGVWYTVVGNGQEMTASTCSEYTNFFTHVSVFTGECGELACVTTYEEFCGGNGYLARWNSVEGIIYHIHVASYELEGEGNFALTVASGNDFCYGAEPAPIDGTVLIGSTLDATFDNVPGCGGFVTSPGVWYYTFGIGANVTASTCHDETEFETEITVYKGGCGDLQCVEEQVSTGLCGTKSTVTFETDPEKIYFIHVHGYGIGQFGLSLSEEGQYCSSASDLSAGLAEAASSGIQLQGFTEGAPSIAATACGFDDELPALWYVVEGWGTEMSIFARGSSFCLDDATPTPGDNVQVSILTTSGDDDNDNGCEDNGANLQCVGVISPCDFNVIETNVNQKYFILVQKDVVDEEPTSPPTSFVELIEGDTPPEVPPPIITSEFNINIGQVRPVSCGNAVALLPTSPVSSPEIREQPSTGDYYSIRVGATVHAEELFFAAGGLGAYPGCGGADGFSLVEYNFGSVARWYTLVGTGGNVTASTCHAETNFDTQLLVYSATSCNDEVFTCVAGSNNFATDGEENNEEDTNQDNFFALRSPSSSSVSVAAAATTLITQDDDNHENCGTTKSKVTWQTEPGVTYYLIIHGQIETRTANYVLTIDSSS